MDTQAFSFPQVDDEFTFLVVHRDADPGGLAVGGSDTCDAAEPHALVAGDPAVRNLDVHVGRRSLAEPLVGSLAHARVAYPGWSTPANRLSGTGAG